MKMKSFTTEQVEEVLPFVNKLGYTFTVEELSTIITNVSEKIGSVFTGDEGYNQRRSRAYKYVSKKRKNMHALLGSTDDVFNNAIHHPVTNQSFESILYDAIFILKNTETVGPLQAHYIPPLDLRVLYPAARIYGMIFVYRTKSKQPEESYGNAALRGGIRKMIINLIDLRDAYTYTSYIKALDLFVEYIAELSEEMQEEFFDFLSSYQKFRLRMDPGSQKLSEVLVVNSSKFSDFIICEYVGSSFNLESLQHVDPFRPILKSPETLENNALAIKTITDEYVSERTKLEPFLDILKNRLGK